MKNAPDNMKKEVSRLRGEVRKLAASKPSLNPFTSYISGNYWTQ